MFFKNGPVPPGKKIRRPARVCRQVFVPHVNVFAKKLLSPGFRAARQCFCCKEVIIAHNRVARPLSMKLCKKKSISQRRTRKKSYPLRMITGPKECRTEMCTHLEVFL